MTTRGRWTRGAGALAATALALGLGTVALGMAPAGATTTQSVVPVVNCSYKNTTTGMYNIEFGYQNPNSASVTVAIGSLNEFGGGELPQNSGQPTTFAAGTHSDVFIVTAQQNVTWTLDGTTINAPGSTTCSSNPGPGPWYGSAVVFPSISCSFVDTGTGKTNSVFGYTNPFSTTETVAIGSTNEFTGTPSSNAGQPTSYTAGTKTSAFIVTHTGGINWFITNNNVAAPSSTKCATNPVPIVSSHTGSAVVVTIFAVGGIIAFFAVRRRTWFRQLLRLS